MNKLNSSLRTHKNSMAKMKWWTRHPQKARVPLSTLRFIPNQQIHTIEGRVDKGTRAFCGLHVHHLPERCGGHVTRKKREFLCPPYIEFFHSVFTVSE